MLTLPRFIAQPSMGVRSFRLQPPSKARLLPQTSLIKGVAKAALHCARRTSTFLACAFREQEDDQVAPVPFEWGDAIPALLSAISGMFVLVPTVHALPNRFLSPIMEELI